MFNEVLLQLVKLLSRHFRCSYLKVNKVSKSEGTRKVKMRIISDSVLIPKFSKSVHASRNYSLPKLARFWRHTVELRHVFTKHCQTLRVIFKKYVIRT